MYNKNQSNIDWLIAIFSFKPIFENIFFLLKIQGCNCLQTYNYFGKKGFCIKMRVIVSNQVQTFVSTWTGKVTNVKHYETSFLIFGVFKMGNFWPHNAVHHLLLWTFRGQMIKFQNDIMPQLDMQKWPKLLCYHLLINLCFNIRKKTSWSWAGPSSGQLHTSFVNLAGISCYNAQFMLIEFRWSSQVV